MLTEIPGWHLGFWNNICFKKSGAIPGHGAGKQGVLEGLEFLTGTQMWAWRPGIYWISCSSLDCYSLGTGTKPGSGVWVALAPRELLRRADSMDCWSWAHRKIRLFWVTLSWLHGLHSTPKIKELMEKNFVGLPQLPWSLSKTFPCFSDDCWTLCLTTFSSKPGEQFLSCPFSVKNQSLTLAVGTQVAAAVFPPKAELLFNSNHQ